jgi:hypothetical protein
MTTTKPPVTRLQNLFLSPIAILSECARMRSPTRQHLRVRLRCGRVGTARRLPAPVTSSAYAASSSLLASPSCWRLPLPCSACSDCLTPFTPSPPTYLTLGTHVHRNVPECHPTTPRRSRKSSKSNKQGTTIEVGYTAQQSVQILDGIRDSFFLASYAISKSDQALQSYPYARTATGAFLFLRDRCPIGTFICKMVNDTHATKLRPSFPPLPLL